ncbi:MAG: cob(I)yrinic acid a,c-diamide adenosyltransferase [Opitutales bacterium]|nr:cob(I)yrinic acid a,c-diamide adenosyltransferase [Opitutales bacterium]
MKISTKTGDKGECSLMFAKRVPKFSQRVCAYGAVDEFSAALGLARAHSESESLNQDISEVLRALIKLMTELATPPEKFSLLAEKNIPILAPADLEKIERLIDALESGGSTFCGWTIPGENPLEARLNFARTLCRRAERETARLNAEEPLERGLPLAYLNRLSDLIYLWSLKAAKRI